MVDYSRLDTMIRASVMSSKKIAICPFAEEGMFAKQILNLRWGVQESYIIDNRLAEINPAIISVNDLKEKDTDGLIILLTIPNKEINQILVNQINSLGLNVEIQNILKPALMHSPSKEEYFKTLKDKLRVRGLQDNLEFIRVGKPYDGGYVLADDFAEDMTVYSFGIAGDVSFDEQLANKNMNIHMYDHTIPCLPKEHDKFHFHKTGISAIDEPENSKLSMKTILESNGHEDNHNMILKMDVEGAEWDFINTTSSDILNQFTQITFELHRLTDIANAENILKALDKLNETHQLVWIHANNFGHIEEAGNIEIPAYVEVTYLNKARYSFKEEECIFPLDIDMPDDPRIEEFIFGNWGSER